MFHTEDKPVTTKINLGLSLICVVAAGSGIAGFIAGLMFTAAMFQASVFHVH